MQLIRGLHNANRVLQGCALTIGNFDGVHLGIKPSFAICVKSWRIKFTHGGIVIWITASWIFYGENAPARLMRLRDKIYYLEKAKVDVVIVAKFDRTLPSN